MQEAIKKVEVLIEALPYIKAFQGKVIVIKYGGSIIVDKKKRKNILEDIIFMNYAGMYPVIVHGGGPYINKRLKKKRIKSRFVRGLRVTDDKSINAIKEVIARVNRQIVNEIRQLGGKAQGLTRKNHIVKVKKNTRFGNIGYVGEIVSINTHRIEEVLRRGVIPVISPLGIGKDGMTYNINADDASAAVAKHLKAQKLALLTNVDGIYRNKNDRNSLISTLTIKQVRGLMARRKIGEGMIPKVKGCIAALKDGVNKIHIINGGLTHALLLEIFTDEGIGTQIVKGKG
ncbi:MAG: acetylglutamate kinase [Candidatus Omnitrophota bacterium]